MKIKHRQTLLLAAGLFVLIAVAAIGSAQSLQAQGAEHDIVGIMTRMDELYRSASSVSDVEMKIITPHWERTLTMQIWTEGTDKTFIRILGPKKEKGMGTLRIGNEMWNYLPKTNKIMKIPPSMMMGSWMGSDFTNDDLVEEFTYIKDYTFEWAAVDSPEQGVLHIRAVPREDLPVVWGHLVMAIREADYIPLWEKYYDEKGRPMRTMIFSDVQKYGERLLPSTMEIIPENKEGHKTVVRYTNAVFDMDVDDNIFSLKNLRSQR